MTRAGIARRAGVLLVGIATVFVATATTAVAAPRVAPAKRHLAGYLRNGTGSDSVSAVFTVPTVVCPDASASFQGSIEGAIVFTSVGGFSSAGVATACVGTSPSYRALEYIDGTQTQLANTVLPGDIIGVTVGAGPNGILLNIRDRTQQWGSGVQTFAARSSTEIGVGAIARRCGAGGCSPAAQLSPTTFRLVKLDGGTLGGTTLSKFRAADKSVELTASRLSPTNTAFKVRWVSTCDPGAGTRC